MSSSKKASQRRGGILYHEATVSNVMCYMDQASFVGLRALGRGPIINFTWIYTSKLDHKAVEQFNLRRAKGLLGRLIQRSPLPWGRHRWVACPVPAPIIWSAESISKKQLSVWRNKLSNLPVDPEFGPAWRLVVQTFREGGYAMALLVSHTIADGEATCQAIKEALSDNLNEFNYPSPQIRWSPKHIFRDSRESIRAMRDIWQSFKKLVSLPFKAAIPSWTIALPEPLRRSHEADCPIHFPLIQTVIDAQWFEARASRLGVTGTTLLAAFVTRLAYRIGRINDAGKVKLVIPVSDRKPNDRRGNALQSVTVMADPETCHKDPRKLQRNIKSAYAVLLKHGDDMLRMLPMVPFVPTFLARHLEPLALGTGLPVGCSLLGELPSELKSPCGKAEFLQISLLERLTHTEIERRRGKLYMLGYRIDGQQVITLTGYAPSHFNTCDEFAGLARHALEDLEIDGHFDC